MSDNIYILIFYSIFAVFLLITFFLILYIRNQNMVWKQRRLFQETEIAQQKLLLNAVIESQEIERKRIGEDLHDEIGGNLSAIKLMLASLKQYTEAQDLIVPVKELIDQMIVEVRNIAHDLSPPGLAMFGLYHAIESFVTLINKSETLDVTIGHEPSIAERLLNEKTELALFRIITQLISNTLKHADATKIDIFFQSTPENLAITYTDNGKGFDPESLAINKGMGIQNIQSRLQMINANYIIKTDMGKGFLMNINVPLGN